jgi:hypothetical protein
MGWFTKIDAKLLDWQIQHWKWLKRNLQPHFDLDRLRLITPTPSFFPITPTSPEKTAEETFCLVQNYFGIAHWPCRLEAFDEASDVTQQFAPVLARPEQSQGAAGYFEVTSAREVIIRYKPEQVADPISLVATMAHELSHYVLATIQEEPPAGWEEHEPLTDLTAAFFGFGIFLANSSFRFTQWQDTRHQGWSVRRQGYLSEQALALALAIFCHWKGSSRDEAITHLAPNPRHYFKSYYKDLGTKFASLMED